MAKVGSQKLYNTARAGNGALLRFMLMCPENLSPWNMGKLRDAISSAPNVDAMLLDLASLPTSIGEWSCERLENNILGMVGNHQSDPGEMRVRLNKALALFNGELPTAIPNHIGTMLAYASHLRDPEAIYDVLKLVTRREYNSSREDDMASTIRNHHTERSWGDRRPVDFELAKETLQVIFQFGTEHGLTDVYQPMLSKLQAHAEFHSLITYLFDARVTADIFDESQRKLFNLLSPTARDRIVAGAANES